MCKTIVNFTKSLNHENEVKVKFLPIVISTSSDSLYIWPLTELFTRHKYSPLLFFETSVITKKLSVEIMLSFLYQEYVGCGLPLLLHMSVILSVVRSYISLSGIMDREGFLTLSTNSKSYNKFQIFSSFLSGTKFLEVFRPRLKE